MTATPAGNCGSTAEGPEPAAAGTENLVSIPRNGSTPVDLSEAARQLELAIHDARVAFDCIGLEHLEQAHESVITARAAIDSAETLVRAALTTGQSVSPDM